MIAIGHFLIVVAIIFVSVRRLFLVVFVVKHVFVVGGTAHLQISPGPVVFHHIEAASNDRRQVFEVLRRALFVVRRSALLYRAPS